MMAMVSEQRFNLMMQMTPHSEHRVFNQRAYDEDGWCFEFAFLISTLKCK